MKKYIGVDLGGTNVRVAVVTESGVVLEELKNPSYSQDGPEKVLDNVVSMIRSLQDFSQCLGIGIGIPGPIDTMRGVASMTTNIKDLADFKIIDYIQRTIDLPVYLENDGNVAALAEARIGAGKGYHIVYYITHSTGIGGSLVINGVPLSGRKGYAGEIANIIIDRDRESINHLNVGAVENEASGTALIRKARVLIDPNINSAAEIFELAKNGNEPALQLIDTMSYDFAQMCSAIAHVCDPEVFIIGGGVSKSYSLYFDKVISYYKTMVHTQMQDVEFKLAELEEPGIIGASMLCHGKEPS